jgi:hypothetical protein
MAPAAVAVVSLGPYELIGGGSCQHHTAQGQSTAGCCHWQRAGTAPARAMGHWIRAASDARGMLMGRCLNSVGSSDGGLSMAVCGKDMARVQSRKLTAFFWLVPCLVAACSIAN